MGTTNASDATSPSEDIKMSQPPLQRALQGTESSSPAEQERRATDSSTNGSDTASPSAGGSRWLPSLITGLLPSLSVPHKSSSPTEKNHQEPSTLSARAKGKQKAGESPSPATSINAGPPKRRILPSRIRRAVGSSTYFEDDFFGVHEPITSTALPTLDVPILLTNDPTIVSRARRVPRGQYAEPTSHWYTGSDCVSERLTPIEIPDFRLVDESDSLGRTRHHGSNQEDTSDDAFERRHRKLEMVERRQRRLEKERLVRERLKVKEKIDQLKGMESRHLLTIAQMRGDTHLGGREHPSAPELEDFRSRLLREAQDVLQRYDMLVPEEPPVARKTLSDAASQHHQKQQVDEQVTPTTAAAIKLPKADTGANQTSYKLPRPRLKNSFSQNHPSSAASSSSSRRSSGRIALAWGEKLPACAGERWDFDFALDAADDGFRSLLDKRRGVVEM